VIHLISIDDNGILADKKFFSRTRDLLTSLSIQLSMPSKDCQCREDGTLHTVTTLSSFKSDFVNRSFLSDPAANNLQHKTCSTHQSTQFVYLVWWVFSHSSCLMVKDHCRNVPLSQGDYLIHVLCCSILVWQQNVWLLALQSCHLFTSTERHAGHGSPSRRLAPRVTL